MARRLPDLGAPVAASTEPDLLARVDAYYTGRLARYGATARGVDWESSATQWLRFRQLLKLCSFAGPFSLNDLGCGYGALATFLSKHHPDTWIDYLGIDVSAAMIRYARRGHRGQAATEFAVASCCPRVADYTVGSGIMNVMLGFSLTVWEEFVRATLCDMHRMSRRGFAVNFLTAAGSDVPAGRLYCPAPVKWVVYCREELGCLVEVLDDYGMREVTLLALRA